MDHFANHCRLCRTASSLAHNWPNVLYPENHQLLMKIQTCTSVQIDETDKLPKRICDVCQIGLNQAHSFRLQCEQANARLQFELNFLEKNDWDTSLPIPAMEFEPTMEATETKLNAETPPVATVYIKPELEDDDESEAEDKPFPVDEVLDIKHDVDDSDDDSECSSPTPESTPKRSGKVTVTKRRTKRFQCSSCTRSFTRQCKLRDHEVRHTGVRNVGCTKCSSKFFTETDLKSHMERMHAENLPYECDKCCKGFMKQWQLTGHMKSHSDSRDFSCDVCSKTFKTRYNLNVHSEVHLPKELKKVRKKQNFYKECVCPFCGKFSTTLTVHKRHLRTHTGEQPYECNICNKRFTTSTSRNKHLAAHRDERPHQCQHCQKAFRERRHLANHIMSAHTGERPFQCKYCTRTFVTRGNMRLHERVHGEPNTSVSSAGNFAI